MKRITYFEMDYQEFDELIERTYGHSYEIVAFEEKSNDSTITWHNCTKRVLDPLYEVPEVETFKTTGKIKNWRSCLLLEDMINNDVLPEGNYSIQISW